MKLLAASFVAATCISAADPASSAIFKQYCLGCHGKASMGGINLEKMMASPSIGESFSNWEKVIHVLEEKRMPPAKMPQPNAEQRRAALGWVQTELKTYATKHAGDPGKVTIRRMTSAEYAYAIRDLTGLDLRFDADFAGDSVGGEGFANYGDVQFVHDSSIERYLEAAKRVASHAVLGAGPLEFYDDPGKSGFELSAIDRIQKIYRAYGFRSVAAEGAMPFGLDRYSQAIYAAWRKKHGLSAVKGVNPRFVQHILRVVEQPSPAYPISEIVKKWRALPAPAPGNDAAVRAGCDDLQNFIVDWPRYVFAAGELAKGGQGDERALVLSEASLQPVLKHKFRFPLRLGENRASKVYLSAVSLNPGAKDKARIAWNNATVRVRMSDKALGPPQPLKVNSYATAAGETVTIDVSGMDDARGMVLSIDAEMPAGLDAVLRCTVSDSAEISKGRPVAALFADSNSGAVNAWRAGVLEFARVLPQNSHSEPTPADRDEIPPPFDNTYNQPERDHFHQKLKYYRKDKFFLDYMVDEAARVKLEQAWADLLTSFEYHDLFQNFVSKKLKPLEAAPYLAVLRAERERLLALQRAGEARHMEDALRFASLAWRRPLAAAESASLRGFYAQARSAHKQDHDGAIRAVLTRALVAPAFLYRTEPAKVAGTRPLTNWEMASRLSFFLWSSIPDAELRRAASAGELTQTPLLEKQVRRMLADPKARRLGTEFFGQWLGFYRFDQYTGVDTKRFPEFTAEVKAAMYEEAVSFFEHIVRKDRPVRDVLFGDYTFLNGTLAKYYGVQKEITGAEPQYVGSAAAFGRGGLLRMGAVLTATSAPLRTSPVKRGDWMLRRILGTPTPPPPADAGSLPSDEKAFGGLSLREKLESHKRNATCAGCHTRIDPLGFPFERYDSIGRQRSQYSDGKPVDDASVLGDKTSIEGIDGLLKFLGTQEKQVMKTMSYKLLGYALGRTVLASDQPLVEKLVTAGADAPFSKFATEIVMSKQFRYRREEVVQ